MLGRTISGGATVNDVIFHVSMEDLPFGGVGPSGHGRLSRPRRLRDLQPCQGGAEQPKIDIAKLAGLKPPYGKATKKAVAAQMKR
ncbi:hypothetical protein AB5I41_15270 [Sphingomonas sp. MMS24-JH45]